MANSSRNNDTLQTNVEVYRDYASLTEGEVWNETEAIKDIFPVRLHYMLSEMEKDGLEHIISWQLHGRCFIVHDSDALEKRLPLQVGILLLLIVGADCPCNAQLTF
jgi:hypothetical protein